MLHPSYSEKAHEERGIKHFESLGYSHLPGAEFPRENQQQVLNLEVLIEALERINPGLPKHCIDEAVQKLCDLPPADPMGGVQFFKWLRQGIPAEYQNARGETVSAFVNLADWQNPENNSFQVVNQLPIRGQSLKRPDIIVYVNGMPLAVFELKSPVNADPNLIIQAYEQLQDYKGQIPRLFVFNVLMAIDDGYFTRIGTTSSEFSRFVPWSSIDGKTQVPSTLEAAVKGIFPPERFLTLVRDFAFYIFNGKKPLKILAGWHQFFAVSRSLPAVLEALKQDGKAGTLWHTQGSGKSFTMLMLCALLAREAGNPTIVILTDRNDLDDQLYQTFCSGEDFLNTKAQQADSAEHLKDLLNRQSGGIIFSTLQKFRGKGGTLIETLSQRRDIIVIADEAHRSHYGADIRISYREESGSLDKSHSFSKQVRTALPNASFIGFTGTPIEETDRSTREVFGETIHSYGMAQSVKDKMTVPISYYNRGAKIRLSQPVLAQIDLIYENAENAGAPPENIERSKKEFAKSEILYENPGRIASIAKDIADDFENRPQQELKGMIVCATRRSASLMYDALLQLCPQWKDSLHVVITSTEADPPDLLRFKLSKDRLKEYAQNFKDPQHPFKLAIVVDMWLTGFDVPCMGTMYMDKELEKHNLMQAIARVNRVYKDKAYGSIFDYRGIFTALQEALRMYSNASDRECIVDYEEILSKLQTNLERMDDFLYGHVSTEDFLNPQKAPRAFAEALDYLQGLSLCKESDKDKGDLFLYFRKLIAQIRAAYGVCHRHSSEAQQILVSIYLALNAQLNKSLNVGEYSAFSLNKQIEKLVSQTVLAGDVENILNIQGGSGIRIFDPELLARIAAMPQKNIAIKAIERILRDKISATAKTNLSESRRYSEMLRDILQRYENKQIGSLEVIKGLLEMAESIVAEGGKAKDLGLSDAEYAFYCAITDKTVEDILGTAVLCDMAHRLAGIVRSSKTIDWHLKESARARMRMEIKRLLRKFKYPPKGVESAVKQIIEQAEEQEV